jgi:hypothetical protein
MVIERSRGFEVIAEQTACQDHMTAEGSDKFRA